MWNNTGENSSSPGEEEEEDDEYVWEVKSRFCGCWTGVVCHVRRDGQRLLGQGESEELWVVKSLKKAKEVSERVAGPTWKNFLRRLGRGFRKKTNYPMHEFRYDPQSYALNFDDGEEAQNIES